LSKEEIREMENLRNELKFYREKEIEKEKEKDKNTINA